MDDLFGGIYEKAVEAHKNIQGLQTKTAQELAETKAANAALQAQVQTLQTPPTPQPQVSAPTPNADTAQGSLFDWSQGTLWEETGSLAPAVKEQLANVPPEVLAQAETLMADGRKYRTDRATSAITSTLGSMENFETLGAWAKENKPAHEFERIQSMFNDPATSSYALQGLRNEYEAAGGNFESVQSPTQTTQEPSILPPTAGGSMSGMAPLRSTDPEFSSTIAKAYESKDPEQIKAVEARVALGMK